MAIKTYHKSTIHINVINISEIIIPFKYLYIKTSFTHNSYLATYRMYGQEKCSYMHVYMCELKCFLASYLATVSLSVRYKSLTGIKQACVTVFKATS